MAIKKDVDVSLQNGRMKKHRFSDDFQLQRFAQFPSKPQTAILPLSSFSMPIGLAQSKVGSRLLDQTNPGNLGGLVISQHS